MQDGDNALASAEAIPTGTGDDHVVSTSTRTDCVGSTPDASHAALRVLGVSRSASERGRRSVPGMSVIAPRLDGAPGTSDLLMALAPSPVAAPTGQPVPAPRNLEECASKAMSPPAFGPAARSGV